MVDSSKVLNNWFAEYRELNQREITRLARIVSYVEKYTEFEGVKSQELFGYGGASKELMFLHEGITTDKERVIETVKKLIELLNKENSVLEEHLKHVIAEEAGAERKMFELLSSYDGEKCDLEVVLNSIFGDLFKLGDRYYGVGIMAYKKSAESFVKFYSDIEAVIKNGSSTSGALFNSFVICMEYLKNYIPHPPTVHVLVIEELKDGIGNSSDINKRAQEFVSNFFGANGAQGVDYYNKFSPWMKKVEWEKGNQQKGYNGLDKEDQQKLDKDLKDVLGRLFAGESEEKKELRMKIGKVLSVPSNMKDLEKRWKEAPKLSKMLSDGIINAGKAYLTGFSFENIKLSLRSPVNGHNTVSIKEFEGLFKDENNFSNVDYIIDYLENIIIKNGDKYWEKKTFKDFLASQEGVLNGVNSSSESPIYEEFERGEKFEGDHSRIKIFINEAIENILGAKGVSILESSLEDIFKDNSIVESGSELLNSVKVHIIENLRTIGRNLNLYREREKINWNDNDCNRFIETIKDLIKRWSQNITEKWILERLISDTRYTIESL